MVTTPSPEHGSELAGEVVLSAGQGGDGKHCPRCGEDIGVWAIVSAGLPSRLRCPHCRSRIEYQDAGGFIALLVILAIGFGYAAFTVAKMIVPAGHSLQIAVFAALLLAVWIPVELAAARFLRNRRRLRAAGS
jgi:uncharacterized protein (DUF983 family)